MNRRGFLGGLIAAAIVPFVPKPAYEDAVDAWYATVPKMTMAPNGEQFGVDFEWDSDRGLDTALGITPESARAIAKSWADAIDEDCARMVYAQMK